MFACGYCGSSVQVERGQGTISLHVIKSALRDVQRGTDKTAAELAIRRLTDDLSALDRERAILDGKYTEIWNHWTARIKAIETRDYVPHLLTLCLIWALLVFAVMYQIARWLHSKTVPVAERAFVDLPSSYFSSALLISLLAAFAITYAIFRGIRGHKSRRIEELKAQKQESLTGPEALCEDVRKRMEAVKKQLEANRRIADA